MARQLRFADRGLPPLTYLGRWLDQPPFWAEGRSAVEYLQLVRDPVFAGVGVFRGGGRPVLLVPGFMAGDESLSVLRAWLHRMGYRVEAAGIRLNILYSEAVLGQLTARLSTAYSRHERRVTVVGHSRGGLLAKVLADRNEHLVQQVITLGSPLGDPYDVHPLTMAGVRVAHAYNLARFGGSAAIERGFLRDLGEAPRVPLTSIYSVTDGIVHWQACLRGDARCVEVRGSHVGLGVNREVYAELARLLALPGTAGGV